MEDRDGRREVLRKAYQELAPGERQGRILLNPVFRDAYNRLSQAHRQFPIPSYLWEKWVPELGLLPVAVYIELRRACFVNDATGERRTIVWPKQETIAKKLGVKKRHTISAALVVLENEGFIRRHRKSYNDKATGRIRRGITEYDVMWEFPLLPVDAVELLVEQTTPAETDQIRPMAENRPFGILPVDNPDRRAEKGPPNRAENRPSELLPRTITNNVTNVKTMTSRTGELKTDPRVTALTREERAGKESLAIEIGDSLKTWGGGWDGKAHGSEGFHKRVAHLMPERLVREALMATRDAVERRRSGQGGCVRGPAAYFAGVVKNLAEEHGVDLGLGKSGSVARRPAESPRVPSKAPLATVGTQESDEPMMSAEEARAAIRRLCESLDEKKS